MHSADYPSQDVCPFVCHVPVLCWNGWKFHETCWKFHETCWKFHETFTPSGTTPFKSLYTKLYGDILTGIPISECMKNRDFRLISRFVLEMVQDRVILLGNANRNSYVIYQKVLFNDLEWLSEIFSDMKHRSAVYLRQLSFLFVSDGSFALSSNTSLCYHGSRFSSKVCIEDRVIICILS